MSTTLIKNIGTLISGDIQNPILQADAILISDGKIQKIGNTAELESFGANQVVDALGSTIIPGLIDSHCHVVLGDFTPRKNQIGFIDSEVHGGVTTVISAGEVHLPGRPKDPAGTKALAILAAKSFASFRPGGAKVVGGAVILEKGLTEKDFEEMSKEGVKIVGEIGLGSVKSPEDAAPMVQWAKKYGMTVLMHTGGTSIPGSDTVTADQVIAADPHVACHVNGGPTSVSVAEIEKLVKNTAYTLEIVHCGNPKATVDALNLGMQQGCLDRFIIGNDAPSGTGVVPLGILRVVCMAASLTDVQPEQALCMATGNTAKVFKLDRGFVREGLAADLVSIDAPMGSVGKNALDAIRAGDVPGVSMVMIDGKIQVSVSRNTPPAVRKAKLL
ncbi:amidohydrolase family protein [Desulfomonile tiedjei]|uniref:Cytosine deaminase-like metal-dependent hydrolase n=1 Tax=Desulfomonile tiedjei (strain ATCC 49306 / DSM 6799 / DCB-1) TaxID=706587 RepID=I4C0R1_DESTA|nr:amidohydrolase family protein [Desulfomonile tiedjei]AFM23152.1 cytosine deaminase-like metal-dependent hydrolase [Desulfomonile tiedjei DSM 6799]